MSGNVALDVFIGLVFVFLLYSLLATIIQEMIATRLAFRAKVLEKAILRMLEDGKTTTPYPYVDRLNGILHLFGFKNFLKGKKVAPWFYAHPLIKYLAEDNYYSKPAYLTASNFSKVIIDLLKGFGQPESQSIQSIHDSITAGIIHKLPINISSIEADIANPAITVLRLSNPDLPTPAELAIETVALNINTALFLRSIWQDSGADITVFKVKLEQWFNDTMERSTGWYKKYTRLILFVVGLITAIVFNVDTIAIHRILSTNKTAREQMVQMAISNKEKYNPENFKKIGNDVSSDSLLNETYKMVANDAAKANDILGLGRPWKDSCKSCDSTFKCGEKKSAFNKTIDSLNKEKVIIESLTLTLDSSKKEMRLKDSLLGIKPAISAKIQLKKNTALLKSIIFKTDSLLKTHNSQGLLTLKEMEQFSSRCDYILKETETWFKYNPNQTGGLETLLGWLITALAITLGAPFWFDLLSKLINIRGTGNKTDPAAPANTGNSTGTTTDPATPVSSSATINVNTNPGEEAVG